MSRGVLNYQRCWLNPPKHPDPNGIEVLVMIDPTRYRTEGRAYREGACHLIGEPGG